MILLEEKLAYVRESKEKIGVATSALGKAMGLLKGKE